MSNIQVYRYRIPGSTHDSGGIVFMDETGVFSAVTDFGNYAYRWCWDESERTRQDFRDFIVKIASQSEKYPDYFLEKVRRNKTELDVKAVQSWLKVITFKHYKGHLRCKRNACKHCEGPVRNVFRPSYRCACEEFDNEWMKKTLKWISQIHSMDEFTEFYHCSRLLMDPCDMPSNTWDSDALHFAHKLLPRLAVVIQKELDAERAKEVA